MRKKNILTYITEKFRAMLASDTAGSRSTHDVFRTQAVPNSLLCLALCWLYFQAVFTVMVAQWPRLLQAEISLTSSATSRQQHLSSAPQN